MKVIKNFFYSFRTNHFDKNPKKNSKYKFSKNIKDKIKSKDVLIITAYNKSYKKISDYSISSIKKYSKKFGFRYQIFKIPNDYKKLPAWYKIDTIINILQNKKNKIIVWIDSDAFFVRASDLRNEIDDAHELYCVSHDVILNKKTGFENVYYNVPRPNTGFMIIKNSKFNLELMKSLLSKKEYYNSGWWDNSAFLDVLGLNAETKKDIKKHSGKNYYLKKIKFLSLDWNSIPSIYNTKLSTESIFPIIIHLAGYPIKGKIELCKKYFSDKKNLL